MLPALAALLGAALLALALQDAFEVMLLPRRVRRRARLVRFYFVATWTVWSAPARRGPPPGPGSRREAWLGAYGPLSMVLLFALWFITAILGFGLLQWALHAAATAPGEAPPGLAGMLYLSGATFFTLGYGDVVPQTSASRLLAVVEGGTGFGMIAVVIGYLPVLYQLYSRREAQVLRLDARAGTPPTAATLLCRHAGGGGLPAVHDLLREWEVWCAEMLESHLSYPMLAYYRGQHDDQSWLAALAAVADACALLLVGVQGQPTLQARMTFTTAREVLVDLAGTFGALPRPRSAGPEAPDRLPPDAFARLEARLAAAGVPWRGGPEAQEALAALRAAYEPLLSALGAHLLLPVPGWEPPPGAVDHWERGVRGAVARRLVEVLAAEAERTGAGAAGAAPRHGRLWRRLRERLRATR